MITTEDFTLRPISMSDIQGYWECMQDEETKKGFMSVPKDIGEAEEEIKEHIEKTEQGITEVMTIEVEGQYGGNVKLDWQNWDPEGDEGRIHLWLHPRFRKKGLATKALKEITRYGFEEKKMHAIYAQCKKSNISVCKVNEKAGFKAVEDRIIEGIEKIWWVMYPKDMFLETERLLITPWTLSDVNDIVEMFKDKELIFGQAPYPYTKDHATSWIKSMEDNPDVLNFAIRKKDNKAIGLYFISQIDKEDDDCLIGYGLSEKYRGAGHATESTKEIIAYIKSSLQITNIRAETSEKNIGSHNVLKKAGFEVIRKESKDHENRFTNEPEDTWFWKLCQQ